MILPAAKLGTLAVKTFSKPIASRIKKEATHHPKFRQIIIDLAQANHRFTTQIQRRIYGHATDVAIRPLNEEKAVQAAADLAGELFVFSVWDMYLIHECIGQFREITAQVAGAALIFEVQRSSRSEARKEELRRQELEAMKRRDEELAREVELLRQRVEELELAKGRGLTGIRQTRTTVNNSTRPS